DRTERQVLAAKGDSETSSESRVFHAMRENDEPGIVIVGSGLLQRSSDEVAQRCRRIDIELGVVPRDSLSLYLRSWTSMSFIAHHLLGCACPLGGAAMASPCPVVRGHS